MKRKRQRKLSLGFFLIVLCVILTGCSSVSYHWYTEPDRSVKFSVKAGKDQRLLIITNVSQLESMKLNEEKNWLEAMNIRDYFDIQQYPKDFFLVHYTSPGQGGVVFYNFNFAVPEYDLENENVAAILDHFGLTEALDPQTHTIGKEALISAQTFPHHDLFENGDYQRLKTPNWYEERWK